ncbi:protein SanA, affects membrane permeability for vancomycin [Oscillospiraceae bacterium]|nr:protein SanA, affects membrane permeability for vancomycin [Oscillospiraceae bacterium]
MILKIKDILRKSFKILVIAGVVTALLLTVLNLTVVLSSDPYMYDKNSICSSEDLSQLEGEDIEAIIVLGCGVIGDTPTALLSDRLDAAIELYTNAKVAPKILMSGDHGRENYNEVAVMRQYAIDRGVPSEDIFMDHAGFSTYETMYRAKEIFGIDTAVIVTQEYHLYRALYDARSLGIKCCGVEATGHVFTKQFYWDCREILARSKDFFYSLFKPEPTYLGDTIDIAGSGEVTLD